MVEYNKKNLLNLIDVYFENETKTVIFKYDEKYMINLIHINNENENETKNKYFIIENKEYLFNKQIKDYEKYGTYNDFKVNMKLRLEQIIGYTILSYEKIKTRLGLGEKLYLYVGEIENVTNEVIENKDSIKIKLKNNQYCVYTRNDIIFSNYNIKPYMFSSIEIDSDNKIIIIRCDKCTEKKGRCPFDHVYVEENNQNNLQLNSNAYNPLTTIRHKQILDENPEYVLASSGNNNDEQNQ
jgi:hypothetical protein